jgi:hypothetical protein
MATAVAPVSALEAGSLPPICAKTGRKADGYQQIDFSSAPTWTWILLLFGIVPFVIAQYFARVHVVGLLPMSEVAQRRIDRFNRLFVGSVILGLAVVGIGLVTVSSAVLWGLAIMVAAILVMAIGHEFFLPGGQVRDDRVRLSGVHKRFADELGRRYGLR